MENNVSNGTVVAVEGINSRSAAFTKTEVGWYELYRCWSCETERVWGFGTNADCEFIPPNPTPVLQCEKCGGATRHHYSRTSRLTASRQVEWVRWRGADAEPVVIAVEWKEEER